MSAQVDAQAMQAWDRLATWLTRSYTVSADESALPELRELGRKHALVFLPNHRSYLDPLVLRTHPGPARLPRQLHAWAASTWRCGRCRSSAGAAA